jgi:hypothetical protein
MSFSNRVTCGRYTPDVPPRTGSFLETRADTTVLDEEGMRVSQIFTDIPLQSTKSQRILFQAGGIFKDW